MVDPAWGEWLLDTRSASRRARLARIVGAWTGGCARSGFDAMEFDNLDSYTRSHRVLTRSQAITYARLLVRIAHGAGLAAGQKNASDFNGRRVLAIEYRLADYRWTCSHYGVRLAVVRRDLALARAASARGAETQSGRPNSSTALCQQTRRSQSSPRPGWRAPRRARPVSCSR